MAKSHTEQYIALMQAKVMKRARRDPSLLIR